MAAGRKHRGKFHGTILHSEYLDMASKAQVENKNRLIGLQ